MRTITTIMALVLTPFLAVGMEPVPEGCLETTYHVRVVTEMDNGARAHSSCSAFAVEGSSFGYDGKFLLSVAHSFVDEDGNIAGDVSVEVMSDRFRGRIWVDAKVLSVDVGDDLALLYVDNEAMIKTAKMAKEDKLSRGDVVLVVGCPAGSDPTPTFGVLVGKESPRRRPGLWQVSAQVFFGNSGGPVWDWERKEIVGVMSSMGRLGNRPVPSVSFYVSIDKVRSFMALDSTKKAIEKNKNKKR